MNKITDWLNANKLSVNTTKRKLVLFKTKNQKSKEIKISINNDNIEQVIKNHLGIVIDEFFNMV